MNEKILLSDYKHLAELIRMKGKRAFFFCSWEFFSEKLTLNIDGIESSNGIDWIRCNTFISSTIASINIVKIQLTGGGRSRTIDDRFWLIVWSKKANNRKNSFFFSLLRLIVFNLYHRSSLSNWQMDLVCLVLHMQ